MEEKGVPTTFLEAHLKDFEAASSGKKLGNLPWTRPLRFVLTRSLAHPFACERLGSPASRVEVIAAPK